MSGVFVNYRQRYRDGRLREHVLTVEAIVDRLIRHLGADSVFFDTSLRIGKRYPDELRDRLERSDVLIAVIHPEWLQDLSDREDTHKDWVRYEIATALETKKTVIPLLLADAELPSATALPIDISELAMSQAIRLPFGRFSEELGNLLYELERHIAPVSVVQEDSTATPTSSNRVDRVRFSLIATSGIAFVSPIAGAHGFLSGSSDGATRMAVLALIFWLFFTCAVVIKFISYWCRERLDWISQKTAELPASHWSYRVFGAIIASFSMVTLMINDALSIWLRALTYAIVIVIVAVIFLIWLRDREKLDGWPPRTLDADPAAVRRAVAQLRENMDRWSAPLSRWERDRAQFALRQIRKSMEDMSLHAGAGRRAWLRSPGWEVFGYIVGLLGTTGMVVAALTLSQENSNARLPYVWSSGIVLAACGTAALGVEITYRLRRWRIQVVVDTVRDDSNFLEGRLIAASTLSPDALRDLQQEEKLQSGNLGSNTNGQPIRTPGDE